MTFTTWKYIHITIECGLSMSCKGTRGLIPKNLKKNSRALENMVAFGGACSVLFLALLGIVSMGPVKADTLTYKLAAHERACFYAIAKNKGEKIAVYYSVTFTRVICG
jgi:hypothetical protein